MGYKYRVPRSLPLLQGAGTGNPTFPPFSYVYHHIFLGESDLTSPHAKGFEALLRFRRSALHHLQLLPKTTVVEHRRAARPVPENARRSSHRTPARYPRLRSDAGTLSSAHD